MSPTPLDFAILAAVGTGYYADIDQALSQRAEETAVIQPRSNALYAKRFEQYQRLYPLLRAEMQQLTTADKMG